MSVSMSDIKKLREKTGAGVMDAKRALEEAQLNSKLHANGQANKTKNSKVIMKEATLFLFL